MYLKIDRKKIAVVVGVVSLLVLFSESALAEDGITKVLNTAVDYLTSKWARGAAICAVAFSGYQMFRGKTSIEHALWVVGGIAMIFGAATIVDMFTK
jgi:type IV secretory pathway VirB2 component (pilin)